MNKKNRNAELLAPVGNMESLYAAIQNGADAVYLGGKLFSARQSAPNFDYEELKAAVTYAHIRNVKVYVTVNILIADSEMKDALNYVKFLYENDIDGVIVQDLGLAYGIKDIFPELHLHGSTQMTVINRDGVLFLEELGFNRVVLGREVSLEEIKFISSTTHIELEEFVHGALCVCYSGQCLMSSMIGGRSGNRGRCAQPCRMPYTIMKLRNGSIQEIKTEGKYLLSPKDLNTIDYLDKIINSGVASLKVEGRMKRPEYVAVIIEKYRKALDYGVKSITEQDRKDILEIFNRGFTKGYVLGDFGKNFISYDRPNNRGVLIGKVAKWDKMYMYIKLFDKVEKGDGLEFQLDSGRYVGIIVNFSKDREELLRIKRIKGVKKNSEVYKTSDFMLIGKARESFQEERKKFPINMDLNISVGDKIKLSIDDSKYKVDVYSDGVVQRAENISLTTGRVVNQMDRLQNTPYYIKDIKVNFEGQGFFPMGGLNKLRRDGIQELNEKRELLNFRSEITDEEYGEKLEKLMSFNKPKSKKQRMSVRVSSIDQFKHINLNKLDRIYIGFSEDIEDIFKEIKKSGKEGFLYTDKIVGEEGLKDLGKNIELLQGLIDGVSVSNIGTLKYVQKYNIDIHGDIGLNVFNSLTAKLLKDSGVKSITLSPELDIKGIDEICRRSSLDFELSVYGYYPLMVLKHCPMALIKKCDNDKSCSNCRFKRGYGLKDRKGKIFQMIRNNKVTEIYNTVPLMLSEEVGGIFKSGVNMIRVDFTVEKENISRIQDAFFSISKNLTDKEDVLHTIADLKRNGITKGHLHRGIL